MQNLDTETKKWQASALLIFSAVLHFAALLFVLICPQYMLWTIAVIIFDHLSIVAAGLLPRTQVLGSNWTALPKTAQQRSEIAITIDDGPNPEVTPQVLDILDENGVKATFFCIGKQAERYPELCREIVQRGHGVENHTHHHWHYFSLLINPKKIRLEIETAQQILTQITGSTPLFFRPTAGLRNLLLDPVLFSLRLQLASWTRRGFDTRQSNPEKVLHELLKNLKAGDILLLHDGNCAHTATGIPIILAVLPRLLQAIKAQNLQPVTLQSTLLNKV